METATPQYPKLSQLLSGGISSLVERLKKLEIPFQSVLISAVVFGLKKCSTKLAFNCPERNFKFYSMLFTFAPVLIFFCLALILSKSFWKIVAGCCRLPTNQRRVVWQSSRKFVYFCAIPPVVWLLFVFVDAEFYVCGKLGPLQSRLNKTEPSQHRYILTKFDSARAESQIIAIVLMASVLVLSTILLSLDRCCTNAESSISNEEEYLHYLGEEEVKLFNETLGPMAKQEAKEHLEALFEKYKDVDNPMEKVRLIAKEIHTEFPWVSDSN